MLKTVIRRMPLRGPFFGWVLQSQLLAEALILLHLVSVVYSLTKWEAARAHGNLPLVTWLALRFGMWASLSKRLQKQLKRVLYLSWWLLTCGWTISWECLMYWDPVLMYMHTRNSTFVLRPGWDLSLMDQMWTLLLSIGIQRSRRHLVDLRKSLLFVLPHFFCSFLLGHLECLGRVGDVLGWQMGPSVGVWITNRLCCRKTPVYKTYYLPSRSDRSECKWYPGQLWTVSPEKVW